MVATGKIVRGLIFFASNPMTRAPVF